MKPSPHQPSDRQLIRRSFLKISALGCLCIPNFLAGASQTKSPELASNLPDYLTPIDQFNEFDREKPPVRQLSEDRLRACGLHRDTWQLEIAAEPGGDSQIGKPLTQALGAAFNWQRLMDLADQHAVRFLHVLTCTNMPDPIGMGLWEGIPLREVLWLAKPSANIRRIQYWGWHHEDPKQKFVSSLPIARVLEDPPGELPVILCYKLNGQWLAPKNGGPVRLFVPGAYGNKSVKWLQHVHFSSGYQAIDTYAQWKNDVESPLKTQARFLKLPKKIPAGTGLPILGLAQVGMSGLLKVQYFIQPAGIPSDPQDPYWTKPDWRDAQIEPATTQWGGGLPEGKLPEVPLQFHPQGQPKQWPLKYGIAFWRASASFPTAGTYRIGCRAIDANGIAQPLPRPFARSGDNSIHLASVTVG